MNKQRSLRTTLFRHTLIPGLGVMLILSGVILLSFRLIQQEIIEREQFLLSALSRQGNQYLVETEQLMVTVSQAIFDEALAGNSQLIKQVQSNYSRFTALFLMDDTGLVIAESTTALSLLGLDMSGAQYFNQPQQPKQVHFSDTFISPTSSQVSVMASVPIVENNQLQGILVGELSLEVLQQVIEQVNQNNNSISFIVDQRGTLLAHPVARWVQEQRHFGDLALVQDGLAGQTGSRLFYNNHQNTWQIGHVTTMNNGWLVITTQPLGVAAQPLITLALVSALAFSFSVVLFLYVQRRSLREVTRPVSALVRKADALTEGQYKVLSDDRVGEFREIVSLEQSFNQMAESVQEHTTRLIAANAALQKELEERKRAETALRESEENLRITLNSIGDAVISTDTNGSITRMNLVAETLTGWQRDEATGQPLMDVFCIVDEQSRQPAQNPAEKVLKSGKIVGLANSTVLIARDGTEYQIADSGAPIRDEQGNILGVVLVFRDVTEQLRTEQELLKAKKLESVGLLAGGIAHDFNNLLTALFGNIEMAKTYLVADHPSYQFLEAAGRSMERTTDLTKQLLTFARGGDPVKKTLPIGNLLIETAQFSVRGSKVKLQTDIASDLWPVEADAGQLSQVISNLIINGQQAMPLGGTIIITAKNTKTPEGRYVKISIADEGTGIASQHLDNIFDPYFTTKETGSGLGLAITHSIIDKHNGRITVNSQPNHGTLFTIYLPASKKMADSLVIKPAAKPQSAADFSARILVMDDQEDVRAVIGTMLSTLGHQVAFAIDGQEALAMYRASYENGTPYDIIITDLTIPGGMGGEEASQEILRIDPGAKIIASSGYANNPIMANYQEYGFRAIAAKPIHFADLRQVIEQVLKM